MGKGLSSSGLMIPAGVISSIAAAGQADHPGDYTSYDLDVSDVDRIVFQCEATGGNASATGEVHFNFVATLNGTDWDTDPVLEIAVTLAGVATIRGTEGLDCRGMRTLRLLFVENNDASYTATNVQCLWGKTYGSGYK